MREYINIVEQAETMAYYHGSGKPLEIGTVLTANKGDKFVRRKKLAIIQTEAIMEEMRPEGMIPRRNSVFFVDHPLSVAKAGGLTDFIYEVSPIGSFERSHTGWWNLINQGYNNWSLMLDIDSQRQCAKNYWEGIECTARGEWEYRCTKLLVLAEKKY